MFIETHSLMLLVSEWDHFNRLMRFLLVEVQKGYDYIIGTSEHGEKIRSAELILPKFE